MTWLLLIFCLAFAIPIGIVALTVIATELEQAANRRIGQQLHRHIKKVARWFCWGYTALLACGSLVGLVIGLTSIYGVLSGVGCNFYDALLYGIDCRGFVGAETIEILVAFPLLIVQFTAVFISSPIGPVLVFLMWLPVVVAVYSLIKHLTTKPGSCAATSGAKSTQGIF